MVLDYKKVFGYKKGEGPEGPSLLQKDNSNIGFDIPPDNAKGEKMNDKKYVVICDVLIENGVRHIKGEEIKTDISDERAAALIRAGYIELVGPEAAKVETKAPEAPENDKMIDKAPEKKGATGKGADLLKKKGKK